MIGETVRPPCVVSSPKSSPSDRSHKTFPSRLKPIRVSAAAKHVDVTGRWVANRRRPADAMRRHVAQVDVEAMFPQELPVSALKHISRSCNVSPLPAEFCKINTISHHDWRRATAVRALSMRGYRRQETISPAGSSLTRCRRGPVRAIPPNRSQQPRAKKQGKTFKKMEIRLVILEVHAD